MNLERELGALRIDWPETPQFQLDLRRRRRRWPLVAAVALAALATALAVPDSRGAILRLFHIGGVTVQVVETLPPAGERPLTAGLGQAVSLAGAKRAVPDLLLPDLAEQPALYLAPGNTVSMVFRHQGQPVLLSELPGTSFGFLKKLASGASRVDFVKVGEDSGLWISGRKHAVFFGPEPARLAGDVLLWVRGTTTYRLEGKTLTKAEAMEIAKSLRRG